MKFIRRFFIIYEQVIEIGYLRREVLEKFYAHGQPSPIFLEDLLKAKAGLHVVFEKLLLHALGSIYLKFSLLISTLIST